MSQQKLNREAMVLRLKKHSTDQLEYKLKNKLFNNDEEVEVAKEIIAERKSKKSGTGKPVEKEKAVDTKTEKKPVVEKKEEKAVAGKVKSQKNPPVLEGFEGPKINGPKDAGKGKEKAAPKVKKEKKEGGPKKGDKAKLIIEMMAKGKSAEDIAKAIEEKGLSGLTGAKLLQNIKGNIQYHKNKQEAAKGKK